MSTIKLTNGLRKLKAAQIKSDGSYEAIITVADLTQITAETAEGETKLAAGNYVIYSKKNKGLTTGSLGLYALEGDAEKTLFGAKENTSGNLLYGMKDEKKLVVTSKEQENAVTCSKCGYTIEQLNPAFLENICTVQNCKKCGKDLTSAGIVTKMKTEYDSESNSFITSKKSFHCAECDSELTDYQVNYFKL